MNPTSGIPITPKSIPSDFGAIEFGKTPEFGKAPAADGPAFKEFMLDAIDQVNSMQKDADHAVEQLMTGGDVNTAEVLTAIQKADLSFRMMMQVRNKLIQAYQEIKDIRI